MGDKQLIYPWHSSVSVGGWWVGVQSHFNVNQTTIEFECVVELELLQKSPFIHIIQKRVNPL